VKARGELEALEGLLLLKAHANQVQDGHLASRPIDQVLALGGQLHVLDVVAS
jgi:hypothetical protein